MTCGHIWQPLVPISRVVIIMMERRKRILGVLVGGDYYDGEEENFGEFWWVVIIMTERRRRRRRRRTFSISEITVPFMSLFAIIVLLFVILEFQAATWPLF